MTPVQAYNLRMRLLVAGYVPFPVVGGKPATVLREAPTENYVRSWAQRYPDSETGILIEGQAVVVTLVPNKRERNRLHKLAQRRASGALPRGEWLKANNISQTEPWKQVGISRAAWYRRKRAAVWPDSADTGDSMPYMDNKHL
jgi:hypothetical protein